MAWEPGQMHRTLLIQRVGKKYKIYMFQRTRNQEGTSYLEPIPSDSLSLRDFAYDEVEFFDHPGIQRGSNATELGLTGTHPDQIFGGREG